MYRKPTFPAKLLEREVAKGAKERWRKDEAWGICGLLCPVFLKPKLHPRLCCYMVEVGRTLWVELPLVASKSVLTETDEWSAFAITQSGKKINLKKWWVYGPWDLKPWKYILSAEFLSVTPFLVSIAADGKIAGVGVFHAFIQIQFLRMREGLKSMIPAGDEPQVHSRP